MKLPIVINDCAIAERSGDLGVYSTLDAAEAACEPYVAEDPQVRAYDAEGRRLKLVADWPRYRCRFEYAAEAAPNLVFMERLLREHLSEAWQVEDATMSVDDMLAAIHARAPNPYSS